MSRTNSELNSGQSNDNISYTPDILILRDGLTPPICTMEEEKVMTISLILLTIIIVIFLIIGTGIFLYATSDHERHERFERIFGRKE